MSDPRVFFASERTLLAWVRTGLTIMGFGFVVARFGLFLNLLAAQHPPATAAITSPVHFSNLVGIGLVLVGAGSIFFAAFEHRGFILSLQAADLPASHNRTAPIVLAFLLGSLGLVLAIYLAF